MNREEELMQRKFLKELAAINRNLVEISESLKTIGEAADKLSRQMDEAKKVIKDDSV